MRAHAEKVDVLGWNKYNTTNNLPHIHYNSARDLPIHQRSFLLPYYVRYVVHQTIEVVGGTLIFKKIVEGVD